MGGGSSGAGGGGSVLSVSHVSLFVSQPGSFPGLSPGFHHCAMAGAKMAELGGGEMDV